MKRTIFFFTVFIIAGGVYGQRKTRGISPPGRISMMDNRALNESDISCSISFQEPSGDNTLSQGENGFVTVLVKNNNPTQVIEPKLEIAIKSSWNPNPRPSVKWMDKIRPGGVGTFKANMKWDERLPSGTITYEVRAIDTKSRLASEQVQVSFNIVGVGAEVETTPVFVDVDKTIPKVLVSNQNAIAVVIGNRDYTNQDVPNVEYAINDANIIKKYLINMFGFQEKNIIFIENAKKAEFERIFGTKDIHQGILYNYVKPDESDVLIYYSGHGAPDTKGKKAYIMPTNCNPNYVRIDGYPLDVFYKNLDMIPAKSITIILDACFSGGSQQGMLVKNASPMYINVEMPLYGNRFNLFTSASGDQIASWYPEGRHSLFTYYFLRAIRGEADKDRNRKVTLKEIRVFLNEHVPYMARRLYGREQTPVVKGNSNRIICTY